MDEMRIANFGESSNWVWACFMNQGDNHDSFVQYGDPVAGSVIKNEAPSGITNSQATFNATLTAPDTNYTVIVYWGRSNGGTNAGSWDSFLNLGSWGPVASTNVSYTNSELSVSRTYYYTFRATNDAENVWAEPSWTFISHPESSGAKGTLYEFR